MGGWKGALARTAAAFARREDGASAVVFGVSLPMLVGMLFVGVEAGHWRQQNAKLQSAVDEAVLAATLVWDESGSEVGARRAANATARANGFDPRQGTLTLAPVTTPDYEGLVATLEQAQPRFFSNILPVTREVRHRVAATAAPGGEGRLFCVLALSTTATSALTVTGTSDLDLPNCGLHSNSSASPSFDNQGSGWVRADCVSAAGGIRDSGGILLDVCDAPEPHRRTVRDPYRNVTMPAGWTSLPCSNPLYGSKQSMTFEAGKRYCGYYAAKADTYFSGKGHFIFDGGGISVKSNGRLFGDPNGVALLFANGGSLTSLNGGTYHLTAMPDGDYAGLVIYGDRDTQTPGTVHKINGNAGATFNGALYFPTERLVFNGGADLLSDCTQIVADTIEFTGTSAMTNTSCEARGAQPIVGLGGGKVVLMR